jgi:non-ribosomal peptide synthetase component F
MYRITIPGQQGYKLEELCKKYRISLSSFFYCVWGLLLLQYHRCGDLLFDTTVSGRTEHIKGVENMVGLFINTLPVRINSLPGENVLDMLQRINLMMLRWKEYEHTSLLFIKELLTEYHKAGSLFDSVMVIENYPLDVKSLLENREIPFSVDFVNNSSIPAYDLTLLITLPGGGPITADFIYDNALFDQNTISLITTHFESLFGEMVEDLWKPVSSIELPEREKAALRQRFEKARQFVAVPEVTYIAPADEVEKKLAAIWAEVLKVDRERIGVQADFFAFGGHSLKASLLAAVLHREFNVKVPLAEIFRRPTIRDLARYIKGASETVQPSLELVGKKSYYPSSSAQKRMAALQLLDPGSTAYNVSSAVAVQGPLDTARLGEVFRQLIARHEIFRTSFQYVNGELVQMVQDNVDFAIENIEMGNKSFVRPFDLSQAPLLRVGLEKTGEERYLLIMDMHHIITDGISMNLFIKEFISFYKGEQLPLPVHRYIDYCQWQTQRLNSGELKSQEKYWLDHLSGELPVLNLRTDFPRPPVQSFAGERMTVHLEEECTGELYKLAAQTGTTLFMIFLAALNILLSRYTSLESEDIIIGTTVAGRDHVDVQNIMGLFIETLALRNKPAGNKRFSAFLNEVKENILNAFENEAYPFRELIQKLGAANDIGKNPLFNVMLIVQNINMTRLEIEGLTFTPVDFRSTDSKVDFTVEVFEEESGVRFNLEYCTALFRKETMERLALHFTNILKEVVGRPDILLSEIVMLNEREKNQLLGEFSGQDYEKPAGMYLKVQQLFERQAQQTPNHIAVVYHENKATYRELNERAEALSTIIRGL